jgi:hypothetical protein
MAVCLRRTPRLMGASTTDGSTGGGGGGSASCELTHDDVWSVPSCRPFVYRAAPSAPLPLGAPEIVWRRLLRSSK